MQKIGEEAVVDISHFISEVVKDKYFRNIQNRFARENYTAELLQPPHHKAVVDRLTEISTIWLERPGRTERGFVMGYFSEEYMQQCPILVARDAAGTIQGFMNQVPAAFDTDEATYDMLRQTDNSLGNTNDFLLLNFIQAMAEKGYKRVNLGLSPLVGLDGPSDSQTLIDNFLRFAYANGDRFYSFSGLHRFKAKYKPR
jgi:phosphatidylglycerol lysyltransferase